MMQEVKFSELDDSINKIKNIIDDYLSGPKPWYWRSARSKALAKKMRDILDNNNYEKLTKLHFIYTKLYQNELYLSVNGQTSRLAEMFEKERPAIKEILNSSLANNRLKYKNLLKNYNHDAGDVEELVQLFDKESFAHFLYRLLNDDLLLNFFDLYRAYLHSKGQGFANASAASVDEIFGKLIHPLQLLFNAEKISVRLNEQLKKSVAYEPLGKGGFGVVKKMSFHDGACLVAKEPRKTVGKSFSDSIKEMQAEFVLMVLSSSVSPFVVPVVACLLEENMFRVIMPLADRRTIGYFSSVYNPSAECLATFMVQIASAIDSIHKINIIHRDIKPENILIFQDSDSGEGHAKLADFGLSVRYADKDETFLGDFAGTKFFTPTKKQRMIAQDVGMEPYKFINYRQVDIYALLATIMCLSLGDPAFDKAMHQCDSSLNKVALSACNNKINSLVSSCSPVFFKKKSAGFVKDFCLKNQNLFRVNGSV